MLGLSSFSTITKTECYVSPVWMMVSVQKRAAFPIAQDLCAAQGLLILRELGAILHQEPIHLRVALKMSYK